MLANPIFLLLATGGLIGLMFPFGKLAKGAGVPSVDWAFLVAISATIILVPLALRSGVRFRFTWPNIRFALIAGIISFVLPNLLLFAALPELGAGFTGLFYTLSPILTLGISLAAGMRAPNRLGLIGLGIGFVGAVLLAASRGDPQAPAAFIWIVVGFLIPVSLAAGNVYRTQYWPEGAEPLELAVSSNAAAAAILVLVSLFVNGVLPVHHFADVPLLTVLQAVSAGLLFLVFFPLQKVGGPVYLSQIGYVAAAVGLFSGLVFLDERYGLITWLGAAVIAVGIALTIKAQISSPETKPEI